MVSIVRFYYSAYIHRLHICMFMFHLTGCVLLCSLIFSFRYGILLVRRDFEPLLKVTIAILMGCVVCICVYMCVCVCVCVYVCVCVCVCVCRIEWVLVCTSVYVHVVFTTVCLHRCMYVFTSVHVCVYIGACMCLHVLHLVSLT